MKEILTAIAASAGALILWRKKRIPATGMLLTVLLAAAGIIYCLIAGFSGKQIPVSSVEKGEEGSSSEQMEFQVETEEQDRKVTLEIPAVQPDEEETEQQLEEFLQRLDQEILGENLSLAEVCYPLNLLTEYQDSSVQVQWQSDNPEYLSSEGELGTEIPEEGAEVLLTGELQLQNSKEIYQREVCVYPSKASADLQGRIQAAAAELNQDGADSVYYLPDTLGSSALHWYQASDYRGWLLVCMALILPGALALAEQQKIREKQNSRAEQLDREYPELVSRMQMLLGAGLSMRMVLERMAKDCRNTAENTGERTGRRGKKEKKSLSSEEILISCRELENGIPEAEVYRRLGNRCGTPSYRGLSLLMEQNMTKGGQGLLQLLEQEALEAFENRQRRARQEGEKVSVRLLLPMGMMLVIVLALIMIPAFMSM